MLDKMPLAAPPWFMSIFWLLIFWLHLLSIWLMLGTLLLGFFDLLIDKNFDLKKNRAIRSLPITTALVINLGVPPLLFAQAIYGRFFYSSSIVIGGFWILVVPLLMLSYGSIYAAKYAAKGKISALIFLGLSTLISIFISFIYSNNITLMMNPGLVKEIYDYSEGFRFNPQILEVFFRWVWILSPLLLGGIVLLGKYRKLALISGILGIVSLLLYLKQIKIMHIPDMKVIFEEPLVRTAIFTDLFASALLILGSFFRSEERKKFLIVFGTMIGLKAFSVVFLRHSLRFFSLNPIYPLEQIGVSSQPILITLFLVIQVVAIAVIIWMYKASNRGKDLSI